MLWSCLPGPDGQAGGKALSQILLCPTSTLTFPRSEHKSFCKILLEKISGVSLNINDNLDVSRRWTFRTNCPFLLVKHTRKVFSQFKHMGLVAVPCVSGVCALLEGNRVPRTRVLWLTSLPTAALP